MQRGIPRNRAPVDDHRLRPEGWIAIASGGNEPRILGVGHLVPIDQKRRDALVGVGAARPAGRNQRHSAPAPAGGQQARLKVHLFANLEHREQLQRLDAFASQSDHVLASHEPPVHDRRLPQIHRLTLGRRLERLDARNCHPRRALGVDRKRAGNAGRKRCETRRPEIQAGRLDELRRFVQSPGGRGRLDT